jgi:hypothetical protein
VLFTLNGLGYLALLTGLLLSRGTRWRRWFRRILIAYAGVTAVLYVYRGFAGGEWVSPYGPIKLVAEIFLIALLLREDRGEGPINR